LSLEGLIGKRPGSKYDSQRSGVWIKIKLYYQGSFVVGGYTQPGGERKHLGALLVGVYQGFAVIPSGAAISAVRSPVESDHTSLNFTYIEHLNSKVRKSGPNAGSKVWNSTSNLPTDT
jgi:ATP-dependent DNA ligase